MQNILFYAKKYGKDIILFSLMCILLIFNIYNAFFKSENNDNEITSDLVYADINNNQNIESENENDNYKIFVDVKGAVKNPGVYEVENNSIVNDIIKLAGGFTSNAYQNSINLSKRIQDEMVIYVYTKSEISKHQSENNSDNSINNESCKVPDYNIYECINDKHSIIENGENVKNDNDVINNVVNINIASVNELTTLTGIGESKALAIIKYREDNGNFTKIEDIMNVSGIGEKAFEKIKDSITV